MSIFSVIYTLIVFFVKLCRAAAFALLSIMYTLVACLVDMLRAIVFTLFSLAFDIACTLVSLAFDITCTLVPCLVDLFRAAAVAFSGKTRAAGRGDGGAPRLRVEVMVERLASVDDVNAALEKQRMEASAASLGLSDDQYALMVERSKDGKGGSMLTASRSSCWMPTSGTRCSASATCSAGRTCCRR